MSVETLVTSIKFFSQYANGDDFTSNTGDFTVNLVGSLLEKIKFVQEIDIAWNAESSEGAGFTFLAANLTLTRATGDWKDDGFAIGDDVAISYVDSGSVFHGTYIASVANISGAVMIFQSIPTAPGGDPTPGPLADGTFTAMSVFGRTPLTSLIYKFGLIENNENFNIISKVSANDQAYYSLNTIGFDTGGGVRSTSFVDMEPLGSFEDWVTGTMKIRFVSKPSANIQRFEIVHEFMINPYYLEGQQNDLLNGILPSFLDGLNSLKYAYETEFRTLISNPNTSKTSVLDLNLGSVAGFGENFNGFDNLYNILSVSYEESATGNNADGILLGSQTKVTILAEKLSGAFNPGDNVGCYVSYLPNQDEYTDTTTDLVSNFLYDNIFSTIAGAQTVQTGIFKTSSSVIQGGNVKIEVEIDYTILQQLQIINNSAPKFLLGVQLGDSTITVSGNSDKVVILADLEDYDRSADIPGLIENETMLFFPHDKTAGVDAGTTNLIQWNEDGFAVEGSFDLNLNKSAFLNTLDFRWVAHNPITNSFFELDNFSFNIANAIIVSDVQQINEIGIRNYNLANGSQFNKAELTTGSLAAGLQTYDYKFSQKVSWQDWLLNNGADTIFYDNTKPNNNLNFKTSNFSDLNGYEIKLLMAANVLGTSDLGVSGLTDYATFSPKIVVLDYELDENLSPEWTATTETFNAANNSPLGTSILTGGGNTLFRITWVNNVAPVTILTDFYAFHGIEETDQNGYDIDILSTLRPFPSGNRIIPKSAFSQLTIAIVSGDVVTEGIIKGSELTAGIEYNMSGRIQLSGVTPSFNKQTEASIDKTSETGVTKQVE